ncbi:hypothetical protein N7488_000677 [Penicillium malachiteum]|nr:hypothetical protein N7488_000677 [Penicillium malachiteum]
MASEGAPEQNPPAGAAPSEPPQGVQSILDPSQTDPESIAVEKARAAAHVDYPEAPRPQPPNAPSAEPNFGSTVASSEPQAPLAAQVEEAKAKEESTKEETKKEEPGTGEKRDLDSTANQTPAPAPTAAPAPAATSATTENKVHPLPDGTEEPELKKQKLEANPESSQENKADEAHNVHAPATAPVDNSNGDSKKAGRPKKEKVKDAIKKIIPTDGPGSRTRSRTKGA